MVMRVRSAAAVTAGVTAAVAICLGVVGLWARTVVFDEDRMADAAGRTLEEPAVRTALAEHVTAAIVELTSVEQAAAWALPDALQRLGPALVAGFELAVQRQAEQLLARPEAARLLTEVARQAHGPALALLQGEGWIDGVAVADGAVSINLLPVIGSGIERVQDRGLLAGVDLPALTRDGDPAGQISELETVLGRSLPPDFGQLVVYRSETVAGAQRSVVSAQQTLVLARRMLGVILVAALVLPVAAVALAQRRGRALVLVGLGTAVGLALTGRIVDRVVADAPTVADSPAGRAAIAAITRDITASLSTALATATVALAVATAVGFTVVMLGRGTPAQTAESASWSSPRRST